VSISPKCDLRIVFTCEGELKQPGALLFSPASPNGSCVKLHICVPCYEGLRKHTIAGDLARGRFGES
jgi:hypothetical protein